MIKITEEEYLKLRLSFEELTLLEAGGIDNWEWYSESLYPREADRQDIDEIEEELRKEIFG